MPQFDQTRLLISSPHAPDLATFRVVSLDTGTQVTLFVTGGVNGKSANDTALGNAMDMSEQMDDVLLVYRTTGNKHEFVGAARFGLGTTDITGLGRLYQ